MEITHDDAIRAAHILQGYCKKHFDTVKGERGCTECIFSAGERRKRCILHYYLDGVVGETAETDVQRNYERLKND